MAGRRRSILVQYECGRPWRVATGACLALELADQGFQLDLYDENDQPVTRGGFCNEGKTHLGLLYPGVCSGWTSLTPNASCVRPRSTGRCTPATMVEVPALKAHYEACRKYFAVAHAGSGRRYLGRDDGQELFDYLKASINQPRRRSSAGRLSPAANEKRYVQMSQVTQSTRRRERTNIRIGSAEGGAYGGYITD